MTDAKGSRQNRKAEKEAASAALRQRRTEQLAEAKAAFDGLKAAQRLLSSASTRRKALASHLDGFYAEIDKLTKGKALMEVTPLMVEQANEVIRDAKEIIQGDTYLDRLKEFVPAGNNPVYPDVLVSMRVVRQSLKRAEDGMGARRRRINDQLTKANTIVAALHTYFELDDEDATPIKEDVEGHVDDGVVTAGLFFEADDGEEYFDFDEVDRHDLRQYLSETAEEEAKDSESSAEEEDSDHAEEDNEE